MLRELVRRWENHKLMIKFLSNVFKYLDRFLIFIAYIICLGQPITRIGCKRIIGILLNKPLKLILGGVIFTCWITLALVLMISTW